MCRACASHRAPIGLSQRTSDRAHAGGTCIPGDALLGLDAQTAGPRARLPGIDPEAASFTRRQTQVLQRLGEGKSNKVIAYELNIQEGAVKVYVLQIMKKLRANNRTRAAFLISQAFGGKGGND